MKIELLLDAGEFWARLREDIAAAKTNAWVQTFTFEGDRAGTRLARAMERSPASDRRLLVDGYSLLYHSDRLIPGPAWLSRPFRREVMRTHRWVRRLRAGGAAVRFGNPLGPSPLRLVRRNHKKIALFDDRVAYLGGINFSDHNFAWHDMMFRVESPDLGRVLREDYLAGWAGHSRPYDRMVGPLRLISLNGRNNRSGFRPVISAIRAARDSIDVVSAYLSYPFTKYLTQAVRRGVRVRVLTPAKNNKSNLARHILERASKDGFEILKYAGGMSHMKAMMIDGDVLIAGSSNFDFMSYDILEEHVVMTRDRGMIDSFLNRVWRPDVAQAERTLVRSSIGTRLGNTAVRAGALLASHLALPTGEEV